MRSSRQASTRVVVAVEDPDERVNGRGVARLRDAGIAVDRWRAEEGSRRSESRILLRVTAGRPLVTLKMAQSLDGRTASSSGESKWITGPEARAYGHLLRARHDAILVGIETALADDPELTCRIPGLEARSPLRVVLDTRLRLTEWSKLAQTARDVSHACVYVESGRRTARRLRRRHRAGPARRARSARMWASC